MMWPQAMPAETVGAGIRRIGGGDYSHSEFEFGGGTESSAARDRLLATQSGTPLKVEAVI
jgi:hypothetical protein